jgi:NADPH:quinone reductase-like Zn-dependent oxidoreductase
MQAIVVEEFGGPEVLRLAEASEPEPGPGEVLVSVEAAGVNAFDGKVRSGAMESVFHTKLPAIPGLEVAGTVVAAGAGVDVAPGTRVAGWCRAGYAELAVVGPFVALPEELGAVQAAALPVVGEAAHRTLRLLGVRPGETLLVHGASGGVGGLATQLAVAAGVTVVGTASPARLDRVTGFGAVATEYGDGLVERVRALAPQGIDAVLDAAGHGALPDSIELRGTVDRIVTIADPAAFDLGVTFTSRSEPDADDLAALARDVAAGAIMVPVAATLPLAEAPLAHRIIDGGHPGGKVVLLV